MNIINVIANFANTIWILFQNVNGSVSMPENGVRFFLGIFFCLMLLIIIQMRTISNMENKHIIALVGSLIIMIRYLCMLVFDWGYQMGLYNDRVIYLLYPPLEQFFYASGLSCIAYYSLHAFHICKNKFFTKCCVYLPVILFGILVAGGLEWRNFYVAGNIFNNYGDSPIGHFSNVILSLISATFGFIAVIKYNKNNKYLAAFWWILAIRFISQIFVGYPKVCPQIMIIFYNTVELWTIPILLLHFVKAYTVKLKFCTICKHNVYMIDYKGKYLGR